jgi:thiamine biosynthesis lipoprotein
VLTAAQSLSEKSNGAFDATVGPLVKLWRRARREQQMPSSGRLEEARSAVGYQHLKLDPAARTARLERPGMRLDLGGIAAGYAMDEALAVLRSQGVSRALLDASGDIVVGDPPPHQRGWRIGVAPRSADGPPSQYVLLSNSAVTTSGDAFQHVEIGGKRYSHIVDPHTGLGLTDRSAVTLIAHDGITADSYATAVCVLGPKRGLELVEATPGAAALIVREVEGKVDTHQSATWKDALAPPKHAADKPGT